MTATELSSFHTVLETLRVKYWEIIADNLSKAGWSWGYVSAVNFDGEWMRYQVSSANLSKARRGKPHGRGQLPARIVGTVEFHRDRNRLGRTNLDFASRTRI